MRLVEFASAEEQIALWKLISDSVWQSLSAQQRQEAEQKQAEKLRKPKKTATRKRPTAIPQVPVPPKQQTTQKTVAQVRRPQQQASTPTTFAQRQAYPLSASIQQQPNVIAAKDVAKTAQAGQKTLDMRKQVA